MKYAVVVCDGMSDRPVEEHNDKTPLSAACTPEMDKLVRKSEIGIVKLSDSASKPDGIRANMSVLGYDPIKYFKGAAPLEATAAGVKFDDSDMVFQCSFVSLTDEEKYEDKIMTGWSSEISKQELNKLAGYLNFHMGSDIFHFDSGNGNGIFLVWKNGQPEAGTFSEPETVIGNVIKNYLPKGDFTPVLIHLMEESYEILKDHPINYERMEHDQIPINSIWLWGEGNKYPVCNFGKQYGIQAALLSSDQKMLGFGILSGMDIFRTDVPAKKAADLFSDGTDFVYIHTDMSDVYGKSGDFTGKTRFIEQMDSEIIGKVMNTLKAIGEDFTLAVVSSVSTPCKMCCNTGEPVPYLIYRSDREIENKTIHFDEKTAFDSGNYIPYGTSLVSRCFAINQVK